MHFSWRTAVDYCPVVTEARSWVEGVYMAARWARKPPPRRRGHKGFCAAIFRDAAVLRLQHGDYLRNGVRWSRARSDGRDSSEDLYGQLVSHR